MQQSHAYLDEPSDDDTANVHAHHHASARPSERDQIIEQLLQTPAAISPKYFYDSLGSRLFELITEIPEYYPTRTERSLMKQHGAAIAAAVGTGCTLIDLGAGNCEKAGRLFGSLQPSRYVAVDISTEFLQAAVADLQRRFPQIEMLALGADLSGEISLPQSVAARQRVFFYPGSSIGNFDPDQALALLARIRKLAAPDGGLLIGYDLVKPPAILEAAYDDALGITSAFNLNILNHLNRLIGSDFALRDWRHRALFDTRFARIEMHLEARHATTVHWPGGARNFSAGERIHTESSYKYQLAEFSTRLRQAGFTRVQTWTDPQQWFAVSYASLA
jgi:L-histidine Nalpha-methyltransferase